MTTFEEARKLVGVATLKEGREDADDWQLFPTSLETDDLVTFVNKASGHVRQEVYFEVEAKLLAMTPYPPTEPLAP